MTPDPSTGPAMAAYAVVLPATKAITAPVAIKTVPSRGCLMMIPSLPAA
jgi:hypothetical protein